MSIYWILAIWGIGGMLATAEVDDTDDEFFSMSWRFSPREQPLRSFLAGPIIWMLMVAKRFF